MGDVSVKMLGQFADRLEADVLSQGSGSEQNEPVTESPGESKGTVEESDPPSVRTVLSAPAEPVDLLGTAGPSLLKRLAPLAALLSLTLLLWRRYRRGRTSRG